MNGKWEVGKLKKKGSKQGMGEKVTAGGRFCSHFSFSRSPLPVPRSSF